RDTTEFVLQLRQTIRVAFANSVDLLGRYGLTPKKARVISPEASVAAAAKARATRLARHTMGPKQKAQIQGTVEVPANAPSPTVPLAPAPSPSAPPVAVTAPTPT